MQPLNDKQLHSAHFSIPELEVEYTQLTSIPFAWSVSIRFMPTFATTTQL